MSVPKPSRAGGLTLFAGASLLAHAAAFGIGHRWIWQPPAFAVEPPPVTISLHAEEPPPPEVPVPPAPAPEPEDIEEAPPEPAPKQEPEPEPEAEAIPEPAPEPVETPPAPPEESAAAAIGEKPELEPPSYLRNPAPPYPATAQRMGWEGTVRIRVQVSAEGLVQSLEILESSGHAALDESALRTLRRWRFAPARLAGIATATTVEVPIAFRLR